METKSESLIKAAYHGLLRKLPDLWAVHLMYIRNFRRIANLKNPHTFNEKVNWRKLYQHDPRFTVFADKVIAKEAVARTIGAEYIIPTLWTGENSEEIPFDTLVPPYVIKSNNGFGDKIFVRSAQDLDKENIVHHFREQKGYPHFVLTREWGYKNIAPKIIVEKMFEMPDGSRLLDYKFFVYAGDVHLIQVCVRTDNDLKLAFYAPDWTKLSMTLGPYRDAGPIPRPDTLEQLIGLAGKLGAAFDFVRVDFYSLPEGIFFGEMTFTPNGGLLSFSPFEWDQKLGNPWTIAS